ncbi:MAG: GTPase [Candidatus Micrarchaeia archaeon]
MSGENLASLNAGPEYYAAEARYQQAKTYEEKMAALEEMLRHCPKHKGSQSILSEIRDKMARLRKERETEAKKKAARKTGGEFVRKQGGAQIVLIGFANAGKTALFNVLTGLSAPSTHTPFETVKPEPGMMNYNKVQIQVIDTPSITESDKARIFALARNADLVVVITTPEKESDEKTFWEHNLPIFLKETRKIVLRQRVDYDACDPESVNNLKKRLYDALEIIRVFTKAPREKAETEKPIVLKKGATVADAAKEIHKDFARQLDFARVWGSTRFPGQRVSAEYVLQDGDVFELHLKQS